MLIELTLSAGIQMTQPTTYKLQPYLQDRAIYYTAQHGLPNARVLAIAISGETLYVGTEQEVASASLSQPDRWRVAARQPAQSLIPDDAGGVYGVGERTLFHLTASGELRTLYNADTQLIGLQAARAGGLWLLSDRTLMRYENGAIREQYDAPANRQFHWFHQDTRGRIFAFATGELERRCYRLEAGQWRALAIADNRGRYYDDVWLCATSDAIGHLWIGARSGLIIGDGAGWFLSREVYDGVAITPAHPTAELIPPVGNIRCLAFAPNSDLWVGASEGACRLRDGKWSYFWGKRWLPSNQVYAIAVDRQNRAWLATDGGVACIESVQMTLQEKAAHYERIIALRHNRNGFVTGGEWSAPNDPARWKIEASDNDGLWTAIYCAAQAFQYAVTKDPAARERARKSMHALLELERLTGIPGFPARSIIRKDETGYYQSSGEWHTSPVDPNSIWKGDTSSDELDGHYFVWAVYYDLCADDAEKERIRSAVQRVTDHLMQNNWRLIDKDGKPTRWAIFNPEALNDDPLWEEERGLNSLSILSHLKVAHHITGDAKYQQAYESLIQKHHYLLNSVTQKMLPPYSINHSDDQLAFLCYYPFLLYETRPDYRRLWLMSLERSWQIERPERSPLFNFIYGALTGKPCDVEASVQTLQEWPWDLRNWQCRNSHRLDIVLDTRTSRFGDWQSASIVPYSEREVMRWNGNPYRLDGGDPLGRGEDDGSAFLLPYWMGRYHRLIEE
ncbi:MAG: two-component regulator propeller domain-containing protein [Fimbriimonadales bacterium]